MIGKTLTIKPNTKQAFLNFLCERVSTEYQGVIGNHIDLLIKVFELNGSQNLRLVRHTMWYMEQLMECFLEDQRKDSSFLYNYLPLYFAIALEVFSGAEVVDEPVEWGQVPCLLRKPSTHNDTADSETNDNGIDLLHKYISLLPSMELIFTPSCYKAIFCDGYFNETEIQESVKNLLDPATAPAPLWQRLYHYSWLTNVQFESLLDELGAGKTNHSITNTGELLHLCGIELSLSEAGIINCSPEDIKSCYISLIETLEHRGILEFAHREAFEKNNCLDSYCNYMFWGVRGANPTMQSILEFERSLYLQHTQDVMLPGAAEKLLGELQQGRWEQVSKQLYSNERLEEDLVDLSQLPVLKSMDVSKFISALLQLSPRDQETFFRVLTQRCSGQYSARMLVDELDFFETLKEDLAREADRRGGVEKFSLSRLVNLHLKAVITELKRVKSEVVN